MISPMIVNDDVACYSGVVGKRLGLGRETEMGMRYPHQDAEARACLPQVYYNLNPACKAQRGVARSHTVDFRRAALYSKLMSRDRRRHRMPAVFIGRVSEPPRIAVPASPQSSSPAVFIAVTACPQSSSGAATPGDSETDRSNPRGRP